MKRSLLLDMRKEDLSREVQNIKKPINYRFMHTSPNPTRTIHTIVLVFVFLSTGLTFSQDILQGNLIKGKYNVGFKRIVVVDSMSNSHDDRVAKNRPVIMNMWYPAQDSVAKLYYDRYLKFESKNLDNRLAKNLHRYNNKMTKLYGFGKKTGILSPAEFIAFRKWKNSKTLATENAVPINGRFPLIIYHQGLGAPIADNQAFIEHLTSHGFVVCNAAYQINETKWPEVNGDIEISIHGMNVLIETARKEKFVNEKLGLMGHSVGATNCMRYLVKGKYSVDAIALYDQGINYTESYSSDKDESLNAILSEILGNADHCTAPILYAASHIKFLAMDSLSSCKRTYIEVSELAHEDFTSNGIVGRRLIKHNKNIADRVTIIQENFELLTNYSRCFFSANLLPDVSITNSTELYYLPENQFRSWQRNVGENPTSGGFKRHDLIKLTNMAGTYSFKKGNTITDVTLCVKDEELKVCSRVKKTYNRKGVIKKIIEAESDDLLQFSSEVDYQILGGLANWGEFKFDDKNNCLGFTARDYVDYKWVDIIYYKRIAPREE